MTTFDDRERAAETKFVLDSANEFKAEARRNKKLGLWAASLLGKSEEEAEKYALSVIAADMEEKGDEDVFRKLQKDLTDGNAGISDSAIRERMAIELSAARKEVYGDTL